MNWIQTLQKSVGVAADGVPGRVTWAAVSLSLSGGAFAIEHYGLHSYSTTAQGFVMFLFAVLGLLLLGVVYRSIELLRGKRLSEIVGELGAAYAAIVRGFKS